VFQNLPGGTEEQCSERWLDYPVCGPSFESSRMKQKVTTFGLRRILLTCTTEVRERTLPSWTRSGVAIFEDHIHRSLYYDCHLGFDASF